MSRSIWAILGLRATRDIGEIKRAYAAKLKAIDIDGDPAAFQSLREARDIAMRLAEQPFEDEVTAALEEPGNAGQPNCGTGTDEVLSEPTPEPTDPAERELNEHQQALCAILFDLHGDTFYAATPEEEQAMLRHFEAIAANPILQKVDTLTNGSQWFAGAIAQMTPRSDVLIEPAARVFGWDQADELAEDPALAAVMQRRADLRFRDEVTYPGHKLHGAWNELITPANESSRRGWLRRKKVLELLSKVRSEHPTLERQMDWYRIEMWENQAWWQQGQNYGWVLIAIFIAIRILVAASSDPSPTSTPISPPSAYSEQQAIPLSTSVRDINQAILTYSDGEISGDRLQLENPKLYQLFKMVWYGKQEAGAPLIEFEGRVRELLNEQLKSQWSYAGAELLVERFRLDRDVAKSQAATSADACKYYLVEGEGQLFAVHRKRRAELLARRILAIDPDEPTKRSDDTTSFHLPASIIADVSKRSGIKDPELSKALSMGGEALPLCKVRLALLDSVLDLPTGERTRILRDMAAD